MMRGRGVDERRGRVVRPVALGIPVCGNGRRIVRLGTMLKVGLLPFAMVTNAKSGRQSHVDILLVLLRNVLGNAARVIGVDIRVSG